MSTLYGWFDAHEDERYPTLYLDDNAWMEHPYQGEYRLPKVYVWKLRLAQWFLRHTEQQVRRLLREQEEGEVHDSRKTQ